jgi:hypothetical protein
LAHCARTVPTKIDLRVVSDMAIIPSDSDETVSFDMINFSRALHFKSLPF